MKKFKKALIVLLSLPKTIFCNLYFFPFTTAVRLPLFVEYRVTLGKIKRNSIVLESKPRPFLVRIAWGGTPSRPFHRRSFLSVGRKGGELVFSGKASFGKGVSLICDSGVMRFGNNFSSNVNACLSCHSTVTFGNDVMFGWNVECLDSDNHLIVYGDVDLSGVEDTTGESRPITVGDHVWIASYCHLTKGAGIPSGSVVAYHSVVTKKIEGENLLIGGFPAKKIRENVQFVK